MIKKHLKKVDKKLKYLERAYYPHTTPLGILLPQFASDLPEFEEAIEQLQEHAQEEAQRREQAYEANKEHTNSQETPIKQKYTFLETIACYDDHRYNEEQKHAQTCEEEINNDARTIRRYTITAEELARNQTHLYQRLTQKAETLHEQAKLMTTLFQQTEPKPAHREARKRIRDECRQTLNDMYLMLQETEEKDQEITDTLESLVTL